MRLMHVRSIRKGFRHVKTCHDAVRQSHNVTLLRGQLHGAFSRTDQGRVTWWASQLKSSSCVKKL